MDGDENFAGADINSRCAGLLDGPVAQTQAPVSLSGHVDSSLVSSSQVARNCGTLLMGIEPETLSPLVTNERDTGLGTRLLKGLMAPLTLWPTSAADNCRMPHRRCLAPGSSPERDRHPVSLLLRNTRKNGARPATARLVFLSYTAARDRALCAIKQQPDNEDGRQLLLK